MARTAQEIRAALENSSVSPTAATKAVMKDAAKSPPPVEKDTERRKPPDRTTRSVLDDLNDS